LKAGPVDSPYADFWTGHRTTPRIRAELQGSQASTRALARHYRLNPKTVRKWRTRPTTADAPIGPRVPRSTVLTADQEAQVVACRQRTGLPLDDLFGVLRRQLPALSRSSLHRCLQRHGISTRPSLERPARVRGRFAETPLGFVHIDVSELRVAARKIHMFLAIDRVSKFTYVEFHPRTTMLTGAAFLRSAVQRFRAAFIRS
jgi:hypothetical protein